WLALVGLVAFTGGLAVIGSLDEMSALQARPAGEGGADPFVAGDGGAGQVAPIIFVAELVAPVLLAMWLTGETPKGGVDIAVFVASLGVVTASVVALGSSKAVSGMVAAGA